MSTELAIGSVVAAGFATLGAAKVAQAPSFRTRAAHVGFSAKSYQLIGVAELAGAAGVLAGMVWTPVGYAAGLGLLALTAGAGAYLVALGVAR